MSRVLVTGGAGTIGGAVVRRLLSDPAWEVRNAVMQALGRMRALEHMPLLLQGLQRLEYRVALHTEARHKVRVHTVYLGGRSSQHRCKAGHRTRRA